jgi:uncharacterized protein
MNCPVCSVQLKLADRQGVEINYCPDCRGIWIDRGLDKIIDRSGAHTSESRSYEGDREQHKHERYHESEGRHRVRFRTDGRVGPYASTEWFFDGNGYLSGRYGAGVRWRCVETGS